jgi:AmiR/NasT family two-component response regulator
MLGQLVGWAREARRQAGLSAQLKTALTSRVRIKQAKGVLMERHHLNEEAAFARLRELAHPTERRLVDVASEVIGDGSP